MSEFPTFFSFDVEGTTAADVMAQARKVADADAQAQDLIDMLNGRW